jgi:hypothetical protein
MRSRTNLLIVGVSAFFYIYFFSLFYPENASGLGSIRVQDMYSRYVFKDDGLSLCSSPFHVLRGGYNKRANHKAEEQTGSKTNPFQNLLPNYLLNIDFHSSRPSEHNHHGPSFQRRAVQVSGWVPQCCRLGNDGSYKGLSCSYLHVTSSWNQGGSASIDNKYYR